jgi:drug/metabolite transporter (DMT)-like permease
MDVVGVGALLLAALLWSGGSVWSRSAPLPRRPLVMTAMEMLCGGAACVIAGLVSGEASGVHPAAVPVRSWVALAYLVTVGSMAGYTAYVWLLNNAPLPLAMTYAYVNPVVAVALGIVVLHESFTLRMGIATAVIVVAVAMIVTRGAPERPE